MIFIILVVLLMYEHHQDRRHSNKWKIKTIEHCSRCFIAIIVYTLSAYNCPFGLSTTFRLRVAEFVHNAAIVYLRINFRLGFVAVQ